MRPVIISNMYQIVSITSQGQITIPSKMRRFFSLAQNKKALVKLENRKIIIEPICDVLDLKGAFKMNKKIPYKKLRQGFLNYLSSEK